MEALSSISFLPSFSEKPCVLQPIKTHTDWHGSWNLRSCSTAARGVSSSFRVSRIAALPGEESAGGDGIREELIIRLNRANGFGLASEGPPHLSHKIEGDEERKSEVVTPFVVSHGSTRAGLFRTPISGGVQSATSAHDLPKPALAVRNLMEQARFAHLCTVMSQMHHRREGYPFGSLVDFAPDAMGRELLHSCLRIKSIQYSTHDFVRPN
ncbi:unnamed protein product [Cuscuta campestris]|uniref:Uncharacterized protein n=1 Tax=Cuscuta campestris TaxID=132261 RepID=A0A484KTW5_9ASTE|nr:unnamed protein product [Cuscuta campestris]